MSELEKNAVDPTDSVEAKARELEKNGANINDARKEACGLKESTEEKN